MNQEYLKNRVTQELQNTLQEKLMKVTQENVLLSANLKVFQAECEELDKLVGKYEERIKYLEKEIEEGYPTLKIDKSEDLED